MTPVLELEPEALMSASHADVNVRFDELYRRQVGFVWRALRAVGVAAPQVPDLAQEVFLQVHRQLATFDGTGSERAWLYAFVRRVVANYRRGLRRRPPAQELPEEVEHVAPGPEVMAQRREASRIVMTALSRLDETLREHVVLIDLEGLSVPEAALALRQNVNTTYTRLRAARLALRDAVQDQSRANKVVLPARTEGVGS